MAHDLFTTLLTTLSILFKTVFLKLCVAKLGSYNITDKIFISNSVQNKFYCTRVVRDK